jgi:curli biogenesis system outer membrane secretion channel CsgG
MKPTRAFGILPAAAALVLLASCGSSPVFTDIPYTLPPELDIPPDVKNIGVIPFGISEGSGIPAGIGGHVSTKVEEFIGGTRHYRLIDRTSLEQLLQEQELSYADFMEDSGKDLRMKGVDAILTGRVTRYHYARKRGTLNVFKDRKRFLKALGIYATKKVLEEVTGEFVESGLTVYFRMVNTRTGVVIAAKAANRSWNSRGRLEFEGKKGDVPTGELPEKGRIMNSLLDDTVYEFLKRVAPHIVKKKVRVLPRSELSERGVKLATNNLMEEALEVFRAAERAESPPDGALYNQGVVLEALGRMKEAEAAYKKAMLLNPDEELYMAALRRAREMMEKLRTRGKGK